MASPDVDLDFGSPLSLVLILIWRWQRVLFITSIFLYPLFEMAFFWTGSLSMLGSLCISGMWELSLIMCYDFNPINILMHEGLRIKLPLLERKLAIIPQFAPNTCAAAAEAWGGDESVWPCHREAMAEWYAWLKTSDRDIWDLLKDKESREPMFFIIYVTLMIALFLMAVYKGRAKWIKDQEKEQDREEEGLVKHTAASGELKDEDDAFKDVFDVKSHDDIY